MAARTPRLEERRLAAVQRRIDLELATGLGDPVGALGELRALLARNPLREPLWARLRALLARGGRSAGALELYDGLRRRLAYELGVDPSAELQQLHATLLDAPSRPVPRQLPAGIAAFAGRSAALTGAGRVVCRVRPGRAAAGGDLRLGQRRQAEPWILNPIGDTTYAFVRADTRRSASPGVDVVRRRWAQLCRSALVR